MYTDHVLYTPNLKVMYLLTFIYLFMRTIKCRCCSCSCSCWKERHAKHIMNMRNSYSKLLWFYKILRVLTWRLVSFANLIIQFEVSTNTILSPPFWSDAWSRRRSLRRGTAVLHKRNYNGKILAIKTSQDDEGGKTTKHRFQDDKHTYEDANLL